MDGVTSLIRGKWQPACFVGNLKLIRYKRALNNISPCKIFIKIIIFYFFLLVLDSVKPQIKSWFRSPLINNIVTVGPCHERLCPHRRLCRVKNMLTMYLKYLTKYIREVHILAPCNLNFEFLVFSIYI